MAWSPRIALPPLDRGVDIDRVEFNTVATTTCFLCGDQRGARAQESIEYRIPARRTIQQSVGNHGDRFYGRVQSQQIAFVSIFRKAVNPGIFPDIGPISPEPPQLDVVLMDRLNMAKKKKI